MRGQGSRCAGGCTSGVVSTQVRMAQITEGTDIICHRQGTKSWLGGYFLEGKVLRII